MRNLSAANLRNDVPDAIIRPRIGGIGFMEYHRGKDAIKMGTDGAMEAIGSILLSLPGQECTSNVPVNERTA
jgi:predicted acylesterase/phospholipase RssA